MCISVAQSRVKLVLGIWKDPCPYMILNPKRLNPKAIPS